MRWKVIEFRNLEYIGMCWKKGPEIYTHPGEEAAQVPAELATLVRTGIVEPGTGREIFLAAAVATASTFGASLVVFFYF